MDDDGTLETGYNLALDTVGDWSTDFYERLPNMVVGVFVLVLLSVVAYVISRIIRGYFARRDRIDLGHILADFGFWLLIAFGALLALTIIIPSVKPGDMLASLGIGSLAVGFAFKDILQNWLSGLLILLRMPFRRGDQITVEGAEGTVQRIEPRATIIRTYDGRDIVVPNTMIYSNMVTIHTSQDQRRVEIELTVGYAYNIRQMSAIIQNSLDQVEEVLKDPAPQILCWDLGSTSLGMKVRWWINSQRSNETASRSRVVQAIKEAFDANDIDPTDPQLIYYQKTNEGDDFPDDADEVTKETSRDARGESVKQGPPPPKFDVSLSDPESEKPREESKSQTMLPKN